MGGVECVLMVNGLHRRNFRVIELPYMIPVLDTSFDIHTCSIPEKCISQCEFMSKPFLKKGPTQVSGGLRME